MGKVPGVAAGYETGPVADEMRNGKTLNPGRKHSNHTFFGPGYSIAHPGVFPHNNAEGAEQWSMERWLRFNYREKWGSEDYEKSVDTGKIGTPRSKDWADQEDRKLAWSIVEDNLNLLRKKKELRRQVMENGIRIDGPFFAATPQLGKPLKFSVKITNINPGHNLPSGSLGAQPELWLNVALIDPAGARIWESGYVDSIGDMADLHSADVQSGKLALDSQLFNLQTKFLTTNVKGTERKCTFPSTWMSINCHSSGRPGSRQQCLIIRPLFEWSKDRFHLSALVRQITRYPPVFLVKRGRTRFPFACAAGLSLSTSCDLLALRWKWNGQ